MKSEKLETRKITLRDGNVLYEIYEDGAYNYYIISNNNLMYVFSVGEPFMPSALQRLWDEKYFEI